MPTPDALNSLTDFRMADHLLLVYRIQHALHGRLHICDRIVDDAVQTHIHAFPLRSGLCRRIRTDIEIRSRWHWTLMPESHLTH